MAKEIGRTDLAETVRKAAEAHAKVSEGIATHAETVRAKREARHAALIAQGSVGSMLRVPVNP